ARPGADRRSREAPTGRVSALRGHRARTGRRGARAPVACGGGIGAHRAAARTGVRSQPPRVVGAGGAPEHADRRGAGGGADRRYAVTGRDGGICRPVRYRRTQHDPADLALRAPDYDRGPALESSDCVAGRRRAPYPGAADGVAHRARVAAGGSAVTSARTRNRRSHGDRDSRRSRFLDPRQPGLRAASRRALVAPQLSRTLAASQLTLRLCSEWCIRATLLESQCGHSDTTNRQADLRNWISACCIIGADVVLEQRRVACTLLPPER